MALSRFQTCTADSQGPACRRARHSGTSYAPEGKVHDTETGGELQFPADHPCLLQAAICSGGRGGAGGAGRGGAQCGRHSCWVQPPELACVLVCKECTPLHFPVTKNAVFDTFF
jgi:hypothetical protein